MNCCNTNGRINIMDQNTSAVFTLSDHIPVKDNSDFREALNGSWSKTVLSDTFFSRENIIILQNGIRYGVYEKSNNQFIIGNQSIDELKIIMRSTYLQYAANANDNIPQQVYQLNRIVTDYAIKQVYSEAQSYMKYIHDASTMYTPMDRPVQPNNPSKTLNISKHIGF